MSKKNLSPVAAAVGAAFLASAAINVSASVGNANPFAAEELSSGYNLAMQQGEDKKKEGKCGEGKCGEGKKKEGKCGEGKCGEGKKKEGKCGEGKCGG
ncbi:HvfA family oxazolone/thioamide-modified RiPP metallophore [Microbulbifer thermotolerans]|uniref:Low-complexity protein n=1 Tax=Microbulbifer thermotolerans TaxID=252514 RepID=A0A143HN94_MICTH|nr:hypothetical protein [Microbulbifer thermotolerans]AMX03215.1 hypothetical protein A3224_12095 [Microbulbifer thermotolerans]MCX2780070.1 hypothetical protein [Microbulbifer thermotolerans]MCX2783523.1 hypothetical protein [Microbulbifer thermotolerans]MCX2796279.1 hypothetical protein [Microbulbifer thermotolerans]MCX2802096.1 hypothetical protein [Microbulbifer thermotolerans]